MCAARSVHAPGGRMVLGCVHGGDGSGLSIGRFKRVRLSKKNQLERRFRVLLGLHLAPVSGRGVIPHWFQIRRGTSMFICQAVHLSRTGLGLAD